MQEQIGFFCQQGGSVGNGSPGLKEISDYVAKKDFGRGFAEIVDYMIAEEMLSESL